MFQPCESPNAPLGSLPGQRDLCDVFVKLGGSILDHDDLTAALVPALTTLASQYRIMVLTGGGQAVKRIKANQARHELDFYRFWKAAGLFPEVNSHLLASYSNVFTVVSCAAEIRACFAAGQVAVLAPAAAILNSLYFLPDWLVTMDSIGLYFARFCGAHRYVIVSDVDGIYDSRPAKDELRAPIPHLRLEDLARLPSSKLDHGFSDYYRHFGLPTVIVNGKHPDRVRAAICGTATLGTEINGGHHE